MKKTIEEIGEEFWDKYSEYIDDSLSSMDSVAGTSVIPSRRMFLKALDEAMEEYKDQHVKPLLEALKKINNYSEERGRSGCTYSDTDFDSESVAYGYNLVLQYIKRDIQQALKTAKQ